MPKLDKEWGKSAVRGIIEQYSLSNKDIRENRVIGYLRFVMKRIGITKDFIFETVCKIETHPSYEPLRTSESMIKLKNLRERIEKEL